MRLVPNDDLEFDAVDLIVEFVLEFSSHAATTLTALYPPFGIQNVNLLSISGRTMSMILH